MKRSDALCVCAPVGLLVLLIVAMLAAAPRRGREPIAEPPTPAARAARYAPVAPPPADEYAGPVVAAAAPAAFRALREPAGPAAVPWVVNPRVAPYVPAPVDERVGGYARRDGTAVAPYHRSRADSTPLNNYGQRGNYNPYTGRAGTRSR